jgi:hypothetical protein
MQIVSRSSIHFIQILLEEDAHNYSISFLYSFIQ